MSIDVQFAPWVDAVADAHMLPFDDGSFDNMVLVDVLHHLSRPGRFLAEAARVLRPGGRLVMVEPAITPVSWIFYKLLHDEPVRMRVDPLADRALTDEGDPWDANQAIPTVLFRRHQKRLSEMVAGLEIVRISYLSLFVYPLSGGFRPWSLLPAFLVTPLLRLESLLLPLLGSLMGFRLLAIMERRSSARA